MKGITVAMLVLGVPLLSASVVLHAAPSGKNIVQQGNGKGAVACATCHGKQGQGDAAKGYPYLAGQPKGYLIKQLQDFAAKRRENPVMQPFASALSTEEIEAVAGYFAQLPLPAHVANEAKVSSSPDGERLAKQGKWSDGVPACFQCHGSRGQGIAPHFPAISGHSEAYIKKQLGHWRQGKRTNDPNGLMKAVAVRLDESEVAAVSRYLAAQSPVKKP